MRDKLEKENKIIFIYYINIIFQYIGTNKKQQNKI